MDILASWLPRKQQIFAAEAFALYAAIATHEEALRGKDLIAFVDNEGAAAAIIRGSSKQHDVGIIVQCIQWLCVRSNIRLWVEWIDSDSNPSDGLSRDGGEDLWTLRQGWRVEMAKQPSWDVGLREHELLCGMTLGLADVS